MKIQFVFTSSLTVGVGAEIKQIEVRLNYGLGLANICGFSDGTKSYNRVLEISAVYKFGSKKK